MKAMDSGPGSLPHWPKHADLPEDPAFRVMMRSLLEEKEAVRRLQSKLAAYGVFVIAVCVMALCMATSLWICALMFRGILNLLRG